MFYLVIYNYLMRFLVVLVFTSLLSYSTYSFFRKKKKLALTLSISVAVFVFGLATIVMANAQKSAKSHDGWCNEIHSTNSYPPQTWSSAMDYFEAGNYRYDIGHCDWAIGEYTKSISLDPTYAQAYNNRGYTYMRLRDFEKALPDLNMAISLNPDYLNALKNRA